MYTYLNIFLKKIMNNLKLNFKFIYGGFCKMFENQRKKEKY